MPLTCRLPTECLDNFFQSLVINLRSGLDQGTNAPVLALHSSRNLIDILRFHHSFEVILENLGEVVCA